MAVESRALTVERPASRSDPSIWELIIFFLTKKYSIVDTTALVTSHYTDCIKRGAGDPISESSLTIIQNPLNGCYPL